MAYDPLTNQVLAASSVGGCLTLFAWSAANVTKKKIVHQERLRMREDEFPFPYPMACCSGRCMFASPDLLSSHLRMISLLNGDVSASVSMPENQIKQVLLELAFCDGLCACIVLTGESRETWLQLWDMDQPHPVQIGGDVPVSLPPGICSGSSKHGFSYTCTNCIVKNCLLVSQIGHTAWLLPETPFRVAYWLPCSCLTDLH